MKKKGILGLILIIFPLIFTGCQKEPEEPAVFTNTIKNAQPENAGDDIKPVNKFSYGIHSKDLFDADNISDAESEYKNIQFYSTETDADGKFPTAFVLKCYIENKIPVVSVNYTSDVSAMIKFAKEASKIRTPVYYDIFPCFGNENSEKYKENFRIFQGLLKKAAPSSSIVWSFDTLNDNTFSQYFPGTGYTDYIGMICLFDNPYDCIEKLSSFSNSYDVYSNVLPIIITRFGVSHYSDYDHTYKIEGAEKFIEYFYNDLCSSLEDIKAVIYADENMLNTQNTFITPCDYTISSLTELKEIFKKVTDN